MQNNRNKNEILVASVAPGMNIYHLTIVHLGTK